MFVEGDLAGENPSQFFLRQRFAMMQMYGNTHQGCNTGRRARDT